MEAKFDQNQIVFSLLYFARDAGVAELADAPDLGSGGEIRRGSSPLPGISQNDHRQRHQK